MSQPPTRLFKYKFLFLGATGWVFQIDEDIALKYARSERIDALKAENDVFDILERREPSPHILESLLRRPDANFVLFMSGGSLEKRLHANQVRDKGDLVEVTRIEPRNKVELWAMELTRAAAWLESLGLVHGDLRPANLLLDSNDHLKLADFDCVGKVGARSEGNGAPWARVFGREAGPLEGSFGNQGPRTEQFAIGSVLYSLTRGMEPYEYELQKNGPGVVDLFQKMQFPKLTDNRLDSITHRCWMGAFDSIQALAEEAATLEGARSLPQATMLSDQYITEARERCRRLVDEGLLDVPKTS